MNKAHILGRVGQDIELKKMQSGDSVANFSVAITEKWNDKNTGEKKEATEWVNVVIFGKAADFAEKFVRKGNRVMVEGKIKTRSWEQDGQKKYTTEVVVQNFGGSLTIIDWPDEGQKANPQAPTDNHGFTDDSNIPF